MKKNYIMIGAMLWLVSTANLVLGQNGYVTGDFHQHTTYTDGSYTIGHMMSKNNNYGLDWWANSEHGGGFTTNARVTGKDNNNTVEYWDSYSPPIIIGTNSTSGGHQKMWRWQSLRDSSFAQIQIARLLYPTKLILQSYEMNVPGHEHASMGLITNQFLATPNCNPLAEFEFKFDNSDTDLTGGVLQGWTKSALTGHEKTVEALTWLQTNYPTTSYMVPAHPERKQQTSGGYTIAAFRDMNNAAPSVCFGFESMPGHQKDGGRGGYGTSAVGGGSYGGVGIFSAKIGGLWDALLSEGRNFWLFANSDCHDEAGDFYPGEYQKNYTYTTGKSAQNIVDGLRSGNNWVVQGDLIDSLIFKIETINRDDNVLAVMGSSVLVTKGKSLKITIKARDPQGTNYNTYDAYNNPVLNHIDVIKGNVGLKIASTDPNYSVDNVATTSVIARFDAAGGVVDSKAITSKKWKDLGNGWVEMTLIVENVTDSCYFRLRGSNFGLNVANQTDGAGNPLPDALMGTNDATKAFADLWFYSNPIFVNTTKTVSKAIQISSAGDDLEECIAPVAGQTQSKTIGSVDPGSSDLELGSENSDNSTPQLVGIRFTGININKNTIVKSAYIQFEVDETKASDPCNLFIYTEANDSPVTFASEVNSLTSRSMLSNSVAWNIGASEGKVVDTKLNTSDITSLVNANLDRYGWVTGNAMAFFIKGLGTRTVESFDGETTAAATLFVEFDFTDSDILAMQIADSIAAKLQAKSDSVLATVSGYNENGYTVPSWTNFLKAKMGVMNSANDASISALETAVANLTNAANPYSIVMTIHGDATTNMAFNWFSNVGVKDGKVEVVTGNSTNFTTPLFSVMAKCDSVKNLNYNVSANGLSSAGIPNNTKKSFMSNKALVAGLTANTTYSFRVGKNGAWSEVGTFKTAKATKDEFSFVYFTDPQANTSDMFDISQKTTHAAHTMYPNANFWLSCGDLVETSGSSNSEWEYEQFFGTQQDIWMKKPLMAVGGNHDKSSNKNFFHHFNTNYPAFDSTMSTNPGSDYSFVYGDALFMALSYEDYSVTGYLDSLAVWMNQQVKANPDTKWRIAYYHKTMYTGGGHQSDGDGKIVRQKMGPVFDSLKIDWALQGHDHVYEVMGPIKNNLLVAGAVSNQTVVAADARKNVTGVVGGEFDVTKGTLYFLNNSGGRKKYEPKSEAQMDAAEASLGITDYFSFFTGKFGQTGEPTFSYALVNTNKITVTTYTVDDLGVATEFDKYSIVKSNTTTSLGNELSNNSFINVSPNPVRDNLLIKTGGSLTHVTIFSLAGSVLGEYNSMGSVNVNMSAFAKGIYMVKATSNGVSKVIKITKE